MSVSSLEQLDALVARVKQAQAVFAEFSQQQVDVIFRSAALAAADARIPLARMAVEETGMGVMEDKVIKNHFASEYIYNKYKDEKTCGVLSEDDSFGTITIAEPIGILCGIVPTTNPTSTAIFKALIALKTRNAIIFSPHPRARRSTCEAARLVLEAAVAAGAPQDIIGWIDEPSVELSNALMQHPDINLILATGGPGMVKAAYSSGKPAIGVGAGNTPAVIDETADIKRAVASILMSKTFDNGVVRVRAIGHRGGQHLRGRARTLFAPWRLHSQRAGNRCRGRCHPQSRQSECGHCRPERGEDCRHGRYHRTGGYQGADWRGERSEQ
jgi:acetaldehyde dehydrogenase/alcohol dehydrogenase